MIRFCRACGGVVEGIFSLGNQYIIGFQHADHQDQHKYPLELVKCISCHLVQLRNTVPGDKLFKHFWYQSGISKSMKEALADVAVNATRYGDLQYNDLVLDIGSNDGTLLSMFAVENKVGFEPAENVAKLSEKNVAATIIHSFFRAEGFMATRLQKPKVVTSIAMFYDVDDPQRFAGDVSVILRDDGIWVIQMNYLPAMLRNNCYDNILHEHLTYYSLLSLEPILSRAGLEIFRVEENDVNGGSFRVYVAHKGVREEDSTVRIMRGREKAGNLDTLRPYVDFWSRIQSQKATLRFKLRELTNDGKKVYLYGASTRGNVIIQFCGLADFPIQKAADANPEKWGKTLAGTNIKVVSKEQARKERPDYFLVLPHHFAAEIIVEEADYLKNGGHMIFPLPTVRIV